VPPHGATEVAGTTSEPALPRPEGESQDGGVVGLMLLGLRLLRVPLTWLILGVTNLFAGAFKSALACFGIGALIFMLTFKGAPR